MSANIIKLNRGDTLKFTLVLNDIDVEDDPATEYDDGRYDLKGDDKVCLSICEPHQPFQYGLIRKVYTKDDDEWDSVNRELNVEIKAEETEGLLSGVYYYEVKLYMDHNVPNSETAKIKETHTAVNRTKFIILD